MACTLPERVRSGTEITPHDANYDLSDELQSLSPYCVAFVTLLCRLLYLAH